MSAPTRSAQRPLFIEAEQAHPALRDQLLLLVADPHLPDLARSTSGDRARVGVKPALRRPNWAKVVQAGE
jgi:hypothetical protein